VGSLRQSTHGCAEVEPRKGRRKEKAPECGNQKGEQEARHAFSQSHFRQIIPATNHGTRDDHRCCALRSGNSHGTGVHGSHQTDTARLDRPADHHQHHGRGAEEGGLFIEYVQADYLAQFAGLETGDLHVAMEMWETTGREAMDAATATGNVENWPQTGMKAKKSGGTPNT
jgi:hypothetical protein